MRRSTVQSLPLQLAFPGLRKLSNFIAKKIYLKAIYFTKQGTLMGRSTVLSLPLQLVFPGLGKLSNYIAKIILLKQNKLH